MLSVDDVAFSAVSSNGCRAPVERQLLGDIAYLDVQLTGFDPIFVTASEYGYFVIPVTRSAADSILQSTVDSTSLVMRSNT